jgi:hypothetical protein
MCANKRNKSNSNTRSRQDGTDKQTQCEKSQDRPLSCPARAAGAAGLILKKKWLTAYRVPFLFHILDPNILIPGVIRGEGDLLSIGRPGRPRAGNGALAFRRETKRLSF